MTNVSNLIHEAPAEEEDPNEGDDPDEADDESDEDGNDPEEDEDDEYSSDPQSVASETELLDQVPENELESYVREANSDSFKLRAKTAPLRPMEHVEQFKATPTFTNLEQAAVCAVQIV